MRRPGYRESVQWIAENDDTEFLNDENQEGYLSVTASLVQDQFGVTTERLLADLRAAVARVIRRENKKD